MLLEIPTPVQSQKSCNKPDFSKETLKRQITNNYTSLFFQTTKRRHFQRFRCYFQIEWCISQRRVGWSLVGWSRPSSSARVAPCLKTLNNVGRWDDHRQSADRWLLVTGVYHQEPNRLLLAEGFVVGHGWSYAMRRPLSDESPVSWLSGTGRGVAVLTGRKTPQAALKSRKKKSKVPV